MSEADHISKHRVPVFSVLGGAILCLSLFTPVLLITLPIMVVVALGIIGAVRKERPLGVPYIVIAFAVILWLITGSRFMSHAGGTSIQKVPPSEIYKDAKWEYSTSKDEMRGTTSTLASLDSATDLNLKPPYDGFNHARIIADGGQSIILSVDKGQFVCHSYADHSDYVSIKFDNGPIYQYVCNMPQNGDSSTLYIEYKPYDAPKEQPEPLDGISKSKKMTVEAEMYDSGLQQMTFNVGGLDVTKLK